MPWRGQSIGATAYACRVTVRPREPAGRKGSDAEHAGASIEVRGLALPLVRRSQHGAKHLCSDRAGRQRQQRTALLAFPIKSGSLVVLALETRMESWLRRGVVEPPYPARASSSPQKNTTPGADPPMWYGFFEDQDDCGRKQPTTRLTRWPAGSADAGSSTC